MKRKLLVLLTTLVLIFSVGGTLLPRRSSAQSTPTTTSISATDVKNAKLSWINRATIQGIFGTTKLIFFDKDIGDTIYDYQVQGYPCFGKVTATYISSDQKTSTGKLDIDIIPTNSAGVGCENLGGGVSMPIDKTSNSSIFYMMSSDSKSIGRVDGNNGSSDKFLFSQSGQDPNLYLRTKDTDGCQDRMYVNLQNSTFRMYVLKTGADPSQNLPSNILAPSCHTVDSSEGGWLFDTKPNIDYPLGMSANNTNTPKEALGTDITAQSDAGTADKCEAGGNPLAWLLCGIFNGVAAVADWIFNQLVQPFLITAPIEASPGKPGFDIWSNFRLYGNIILIIALLAVVFGQSIGGGIIDAYTAKKMVPKILLAAILINLSVYIVNFLVDITNIIGGGLGNLMLQPLKDAHQLSFAPSTGQQVSIVFTVGFLGTFLAGATIAGVLLGLATKAFAAKLAIYLLFAVVIPVVLAMVAVFITIIIRKGILLFLILISPIAFALYALPNTERFFRKWWDVLFKTLMVYPIIIAIFAIADVLTVMILASNNIPADASLADKAVHGTFENPLVMLTAFILQFLPLLLIPFAFKISGGIVGNIYAAVSKGTARFNEILKPRRERAAKDVQGRMIDNRYDAYRRLQKTISNPKANRYTRGAARFVRGRLSGYNLEAGVSQHIKEVGEEMTAQIATGPDTNIRGFTANRNLIHASVGGEAALRRAGFVEDKDWRINTETGRLQISNISGQWYDAADAQEGLGRWDGDRAALQKGVSYEIQKALTQDNNDSIANHLEQLRTSWGLTDEQMNGIIIGAGFEMQNKSKQWKRYTVRNGALNLDGKGFVDEMHAQMGTYQGTGQDADTWTTLSKTYIEGIQRAMTGDLAAQASVDKMDEVAKQFENMSAGQIQQYVAQLAAQAGNQVTPGAAADIANGIQEFIKTVNTGTVVAGGKVSKRQRNEVINF